MRAEVALLQPSEVVCVGESFGAVLALKVSLRDRGLFDRLVLVNPATSFRQSLGGLPSLVAGTGLLGAFTDELFSLAQGALLPLLVGELFLGVPRLGRHCPDDMTGPRDACVSSLQTRAGWTMTQGTCCRG